MNAIFLWRDFIFKEKAVRIQAGKTIKSTKILSHMKKSRLEMKRQKRGL